MQDSSYDLERLDVVFDDDHAVPNAGVLLVAMLSEVLGIEELTDRCQARETCRGVPSWPETVDVDAFNRVGRRLH